MRTYSIDVKNSFKTLYYKEENVIIFNSKFKVSGSVKD